MASRNVVPLKDTALRLWHFSVESTRFSVFWPSFAPGVRTVPIFHTADALWRFGRFRDFSLGMRLKEPP